MPKLKNPLAAVFRYDAGHYADIAANGYVYNPNDRSTLAFFPVYPLAARSLANLFRTSVNTMLLVVSNLALLAAFLVFHRYAAARVDPVDAHVAGGDSQNRRANWLALVAFALFPTTFFFRLPYAESVFLLTALLAMHGMRQQWPAAVVAVVIGLAVAARPVGVALLPVFAWHLWSASRTPLVFAGRLALAGPLSVWGLAAYMSFQYVEFDAPFAFARTQVHWQMRGADVGLVDKALSLVSGHAIWSVYDPGDRAHWSRLGGNPITNVQFLTPVYFAGTAALVIIGAWKGWLNRYEWLLSAGLLMIPYLTKAYENCLLSHARFAAVVFPAYLVMGELLARAPRLVTYGMLAACAAGLTLYSYLFAAGHPLF